MILFFAIKLILVWISICLAILLTRRLCKGAPWISPHGSWRGTILTIMFTRGRFEERSLIKIFNDYEIFRRTRVIKWTRWASQPRALYYLTYFTILYALGIMPLIFILWLILLSHPSPVCLCELGLLRLLPRIVDLIPIGFPSHRSFVLGVHGRRLLNIIF